MWVLSIFGQMVSSPRMDWKGWFSQWQVAPQNLQPEHQVAVWCYHSLSETFPFKKVQKAESCSLPVLHLFQSSWRASLEHLVERVGSQSRPWTVLEYEQGRAGGDLLVVEPPVAAVSEEVGFAVFPLEGCVHVTRQTSPPFLDVLQRFHNSW